MAIMRAIIPLSTMYVREMYRDVSRHQEGKEYMHIITMIVCYDLLPMDHHEGS